MAIRSWTKTVVLLLLIAIVLVGCSSGGNQMASGDNGTDSASGKQTKAEPVTLKVYVTTSTNLLDSEIQKYIVEPVTKKYPNITLQVEMSAPDKSVEDAVKDRLAAGDFPDVLVTTLNFINFYKELQVPADLNPLVKEQNIDLTKFNASAIDFLNDIGGKKQLYALPIYLNYAVLFYNKDIFDKFGVGYPKDGMDWNAVIELAKKVSRTDGGVQYYGLSPGTVINLGSEMSVPVVDPKTNEATLNTDGWKTTFGLMKQIFDIPGNKPDEKNFTNGRNMFLKDRNLAMLADWGNGVLGAAQKLDDGGGNWDMATIPNVSGKIGIGRNPDFHILMVSSQSKHKQEAMQVLSVITSKQVQSEINKEGRYTSLADPELQKQFGADLGILKGKNISAIYKVKAAEEPAPTEYDGMSTSALNTEIKEVIYQDKDINTALREAEETANQQIKAAVEGK